MAVCIDGFIDLNDDDSDGCEYECTPTIAADNATDIDWPDPEYQDADCDGIDGELERAIFVSPDGTDMGNTAGTRELPFKTIKTAMVFSAETPDRDQVLVAKGTHLQQIVVVEDVNVFGGYDRSDGWSRDTDENETIVRWEAVEKGSIRALVAKQITATTRIGGLTLEAASNLAAGGSSVAVHITQGCEGLLLQNNHIVAGNGVIV